jgi:hypothetical protein
LEKKAQWQMTRKIKKQPELGTIACSAFPHQLAIRNILQVLFVTHSCGMQKI